MNSYQNPVESVPSLWHSVDEAITVTQNHLAAAQVLRDRIVQSSSVPTVQNTLELFNDLLVEIDQVIGFSDLAGNVHPDAAVRQAANDCFQKMARFLNELKLDRALYEVLNRLDSSGLDADTCRFLTNTLRDYRRSGVDKSEPLRRELAGLFEQMVITGQEFSKNIREGERFILISEADMQGLPADYVAAHRPGSDGLIKITTSYADYDPFMKYCPRADLRQSIYMQFQQRAYPVNVLVLDRLLELRYQYASLLGYPQWAEYTAEDKMVEHSSVISAFIDQIYAMALPRQQKDCDLLLQRKRRDQPESSLVHDWEAAYYTQKVRQEQYLVDPQEVRSYFAYPAVKAGLLQLTAEVFAVEFKAIAGASVWDPLVEVYDVYDAGVLIGRIYLDLFPRRDKYSHVATFPGQTGIQFRQIAQVALVGNFPGPGSPDQPVYWEHSDVDTFLHEFGHVMHALLSYKHHWVGVAGLNCQWDFVEVPSQLFEEWAWDASVLGRFARHPSTGQSIPSELVKRMKDASEFGKGLVVNRQMAYARLSLTCHDRNPAGLDLLSIWREIADRYSPYPYQPGTFPFASFGHLEGYSSQYYCYMWSLTLVKDLFTRFQSFGLMDQSTARSYRQSILEPGGAKDGADLVRDFLGRDFSFNAFKNWLEQ
jgi:thimet oligopeptidase